MQTDHTKYHFITRRLPCGQSHGLLYPDPAIGDTKHAFTLLLPKAREAAAALLRMVDQRTTIPLHPSWASWLWTFLEEHDHITHLVGTGDWIGWDIHCPESELQAAVPEAIKTRTLLIA